MCSLQLSPALRNRFTEIWCPQSTKREDLIQIINHNLRPGLSLGRLGHKGECAYSAGDGVEGRVWGVITLLWNITCMYSQCVIKMKETKIGTQ